VAAASDNGAFLMGELEIELTFDDDDPATTTDIELIAAEATFLARYDNGGLPLWAVALPGHFGALSAMDAAPDGETVTVGPGVGNVTLGNAVPGGGTLSLSGVLFPNLILARYNADGVPQQIRQLSSGGREPGNGISDLSLGPDGAFSVVFQIGGQATFGSTAAGDREITLELDETLMDAAAGIATFEADGALRWAVTIAAEHPSPDGTNEVQTHAEGVNVLPDGSILVTGFMEGNATFASFDPAGPKVTLSSTVNASGETTRDVFLARYDRDGRLLYATLNRGNAREGGVGAPDGVAGLADGTALWMTNRDQNALRVITVGPGEANEETVPNNGTRYLLHKTFPYREEK
jgi:hypothetical protein